YLRQSTVFSRLPLSAGAPYPHNENLRLRGSEKMQARNLSGLGFMATVLSAAAFGAQPAANCVREANNVMEEIVATARYPAHLLMEEIVVTAPMPVNLLAEHSAGLTDEIDSEPEVRFTL